MSPFTRREFVKGSLVAGALASVGTSSLSAAVGGGSATDKVVLGKSGVKVTRLAFGTGSDNGYVQKRLGQAEFNRLIAYAYDHGIRFFETAEAYVTPAMLGEALKPFPRESYTLMTKVTTDEGVDPAQRFDEMRKTMKTDYFDIMLLHWQHTSDWMSTTKQWQDGVERAQQKKTIVARGASVHGLPALRQMPGNPWVQVALMRVNHAGARMDGPTFQDGNNPGNVPEVMDHFKQVKRDGTGIIGMKLVGGGEFSNSPEDRQKAMRFAFREAGVQSVTVGFKSTGEIDEAVRNLGLALA